MTFTRTNIALVIFYITITNLALLSPYSTFIFFPNNCQKRSPKLVNRIKKYKLKYKKISLRTKYPKIPPLFHIL